MTGTPLDLTPFGPLISGVGWLYWLLVVGALVLAWRWPKRKAAKIAAMVGVVAVAAWMPVRIGLQGHAVRVRLDESMSLFKERCKAAGEKITHTFDDVDAVVWMKWRPKETNLSDQFTRNDPYGHDCFGDECIKRLLRVTKGAELNPREAKEHSSGYRFVETIDPSDGQRYRYWGVVKLHPRWTPEAIAQEKKLTGKDLGPSANSFAIERQPITEWSARYGVTWDDLSTDADREHWIAGSSLRVIDLQTNAVIAERVGYMVDRGLGSEAGFRSPWFFAHDTACPSITSERRTWTFATEVLHPTRQGE